MAGPSPSPTPNPFAAGDTATFTITAQVDPRCARRHGPWTNTAYGLQRRPMLRPSASSPPASTLVRQPDREPNR